MDTEDPEDESFEEFEQEFSPEELHPLQSLGAIVIGVGAIAVMLFWILSLLDVLRH